MERKLSTKEQEEFLHNGVEIIKDSDKHDNELSFKSMDLDETAIQAIADIATSDIPKDEKDTAIQAVKEIVRDKNVQVAEQKTSNRGSKKIGNVLSFFGIVGAVGFTYVFTHNPQLKTAASSLVKRLNK
ncbi:MAG: hypothetical protein NC215_00255 [Ruminococcus sp.]|nr:hypothetical protein [Ruminococcus sp.]